MYLDKTTTYGRHVDQLWETCCPCVRNKMDTPCSRAPEETQVAVVHNVPSVALGTRSSKSPRQQGPTARFIAQHALGNVGFGECCWHFQHHSC
jgi:hypothetical protein